MMKILFFSDINFTMLLLMKYVKKQCLTIQIFVGSLRTSIVVRILSSLVSKLSLNTSNIAELKYVQHEILYLLHSCVIGIYKFAKDAQSHTVWLFVLACDYCSLYITSKSYISYVQYSQVRRECLHPCNSDYLVIIAYKYCLKVFPLVSLQVRVCWMGWDKVFITIQKITVFSSQYYFSSLPSQIYILMISL